MANAVYPKFKQRLLESYFACSLNQNDTTNGPYVFLLDTGVYSYNTAHDFLNDITGRVGSAVRITSPTVVSGLFDGENITFSSLSGTTVEAFMIYRNNSLTEADKTVVYYCDTGVTGLPLTPNGGDVTINWNATGIFSL